MENEKQTVDKQGVALCHFLRDQPERKWQVLTRDNPPSGSPLRAVVESMVPATQRRGDDLLYFTLVPAEEYKQQPGRIVVLNLGWYFTMFANKYPGKVLNNCTATDASSNNSEQKKCHRADKDVYCTACQCPSIEQDGRFLSLFEDQECTSESLGYKMVSLTRQVFHYNNRQHPEPQVCFYAQVSASEEATAADEKLLEEVEAEINQLSDRLSQMQQTKTAITSRLTMLLLTKQ